MKQDIDLFFRCEALILLIFNFVELNKNKDTK